MDWPDYTGGNGFTNYRIFRDTKTDDAVDWWETVSNFTEPNVPFAHTPTKS